MKTTFFTRLIAGSLITAILLTACSKSKTIDELNNGTAQTNLLELNQNFKVTYARDGATDITQQLNAWTFRFVGNYPSGEAQAWNDLFSKTGTWTMSQGSSSINLSYPPDMSQLVFMTRDWKISRANPGAEIVLNAEDGDEVHLMIKTQ